MSLQMSSKLLIISLRLSDITEAEFDLYQRFFQSLFPVNLFDTEYNMT